ncbi:MULTISPECIES: GNAT family N-acetyltransferase [unclassified Streptomyces]|uniref:GNAT family N-acetyltransferase n=1 Tax=Streptomyces sp. AM 3-1-1 TaxID=3028711 RepID=UPI0023B97598|nr:GNAT family N-acetyltransferase [Streptomyces sp. AM 3-1-1]WEH28339.1 GNAT family N-acetyltransferase [Streptomyces sp. AM 3-1-1]
MTVPERPALSLSPWSEGDVDLLRASNTAAMTEHLGGPETEEQLLSRHRRYLDPEANGTMFRIVLLPGGEAVGSTGFWEHEWDGEAAYETGYAILPEFQGRGLAVAATRAVVDAARADGAHRYLYAFPSVHHTASNAVCRKAGFELVGDSEFEYPKGNLIRSNVWRADLRGRTGH